MTPLTADGRVMTPADQRGLTGRCADQFNDRMGYPRSSTGGWGRPATVDDICPGCGATGTLTYVPGFAIMAENVCACGYQEDIVS